jgi:large subunit ribosomal protein L21
MPQDSRKSLPYVIIETGGKQFKVRADRRVRVPSLAGEVGDRVTFDRVLFASSGEGPTVGAPTLAGGAVTAEIVGHGRGKKVVVFKYKRRHRYRRKTGHRQGYTEVAILDLGLEGGRAEGLRDASRPAAAGADEEDEAEGKGRQVGPYVCQECGRGFATERGLQQHRAKAHAE